MDEVGMSVNKGITVLVLGLIFFGVYVRIDTYTKFHPYGGDEGIQAAVASHFWSYGDLPETGEISGIDANTRYIYHNTVVPFFFQTILYALGGFNIKGYGLSFMIFGLFCQALFIKSIWIKFGASIGTIAALIVSLNHVLIYQAGWTSQLMVSIYLQMLAIWLLLAPVKKYWPVSILLAALAMQSYPPVLLLSPIWFIWGLVATKSVADKHFYLRYFLTWIISFAPFVMIELGTYANLPVLLDFFQNQAQNGMVNRPTYYFPAFPLLILLMLWIVHRFKLAVLAALLSLWYVYAHFPHTQYLSNELAEYNAVAETIINLQPNLKSLNVYEISSNDLWGWNEILYWYLLEEKTGLKLITINYKDTRPERVSTLPIKTYFLICRLDNNGEGEERNRIENTCQKQFISRRLKNSDVTLSNTLRTDWQTLYVYESNE